MKVLVFGGTGMLGHKLVQVLGKKFEVWFTMRSKYSEAKSFGIFDPRRAIAGIDVTDDKCVRDSIKEARPDVIINAVGVIKQAPAADDKIQNLTINSIFPQRLASMASEFGFRFITVSTDCVFDGKKGDYTENDIPNAGDLYGVSKFLGEVSNEETLTIRTSVIGRELVTSHSIVEWFLRNPAARVQGYVNAVYSGFPTIVLADLIARIITDHPELRGLYHISSHPISKFHLLELIKQRYQPDVAIEPFEEYVIDRSLNSDKFRTATGFNPDAWPEMVDRMAADPTPYEKWR